MFEKATKLTGKPNETTKVNAPHYITKEGYGKFAVSTENGSYTTLTMDPMLQSFLIKVVGVDATRNLVRLFAKEKKETRSRSRHVAHRLFELLFKSIDTDKLRKNIMILLTKEFGEAAVADMKKPIKPPVTKLD